MAKIPSELFIDWKDKDIIYARDYKREREIIRTAVNDNDTQRGSIITRMDDLEAAIEDLQKNGGGNGNGLGDYILDVRVYGAKGDGSVDASVAINDTIQAASTLNIKTVVIPDGTYIIDSTVVVERGIHLYMNKGTILEAGEDENILQLRPDSRLTGGIIKTFKGFSKACIYLDGNDIFKLLNDHVIVNGTVLQGYDREYTDQAWTGKGIHLYSGVGSLNNPSYVSFVHFSQMGIFNYDYGIHLDVDSSISNNDEMAWVNGNTFEQINMMNCLKGITLNGDSRIPRDCSGNIFKSMQIQINSYSEYAVRCEGGWNRLEGSWWDLHRQPNGKKAIQFGNSSRFNQINAMHGYMSRHIQDDGYLNKVSSLTNHTPDTQLMFLPYSVPYAPNAAGSQDDYAIGGNLRGWTVSQIQTPASDRSPTIVHPLGTDEGTYVQGEYVSLFSMDNEQGVSFDGSQTDWDNPLVLEIDCTSDPIPILGFIGITSAYGYYPKNVVFEVRDGSNWIEYGDWFTDNTNFPYMVTGPWASANMCTGIRITMWGSNQPDGKIQVSRVIATSTQKPGNAWVPKSGGDVDGTLNFKGGFIVESRTDDPVFPDVGRMWLRSDL